MSITMRLGKKTIYGWTLFRISLNKQKRVAGDGQAAHEHGGYRNQRGQEPENGHGNTDDIIDECPD